MGMRVKLGHYTAEESPSSSYSLATLGLVLGVLTLPLGGLYWLSCRDAAALETAPGAHALVGSTPLQKEVAAPAPNPCFASSNWAHLERRPASPQVKSLDTDLECSEWQGREVYQELKAMAVYECPSRPPVDRDRQDLIEKIRRERRPGS